VTAKDLQYLSGITIRKNTYIVVIPLDKSPLALSAHSRTCD
jgi:hypothetical protein